MIDWIVKGRLQVILPFAEFGINNIKPLDGVKVKVYAEKDAGVFWGIYNKWDEVTTDKDGFFIVKKTKNKRKRQFRVEIEFKDDDLKIFGDEAGLIRQLIDEKTDNLPRMTDYGLQEYIEALYENVSRLPYRVVTYKVLESYGNQNDNGFVDLGTIVIDPSTPNNYLNSEILQGHASIWYLYKEVVKFLRNNDVGFTAVSPYKIAVKFPHNIPITTEKFDDNNEVSYSNPRNKIIFIVANSVRVDLTLHTLIHELMHFWMYLHCAGEFRMAFQWALHQGTHDQRQVKSFVAFHEAFAEWAKDRLLEEVFGFTPSSNGIPFHREHLISIGADSIDEIGHYEEAWSHFFNILTVKDLHRFNLNPSSPSDNNAVIESRPSPTERCVSPSVSFTDFLNVFKEHNNINSLVWEKQLNPKDLLDRICNVNPTLAGKKDIYLRILDPQETFQPKDAFCTPIARLPHVSFSKKIKA